MDRVEEVKRTVMEKIEEFLASEESGEVLIVSIVKEDSGAIGWATTEASEALFNRREWQSAVAIHADLLDAIRLRKVGR